MKKVPQMFRSAAGRPPSLFSRLRAPRRRRARARRRTLKSWSEAPQRTTSTAQCGPRPSEPVRARTAQRQIRPSTTEPECLERPGVRARAGGNEHSRSVPRSFRARRRHHTWSSTGVGDVVRRPWPRPPHGARRLSCMRFDFLTGEHSKLDRKSPKHGRKLAAQQSERDGNYSNLLGHVDVGNIRKERMISQPHPKTSHASWYMKHPPICPQNTSSHSFVAVCLFGIPGVIDTKAGTFKQDETAFVNNVANHIQFLRQANMNVFFHAWQHPAHENGCFLRTKPYGDRLKNSQCDHLIIPFRSLGPSGQNFPALRGFAPRGAGEADPPPVGLRPLLGGSHPPTSTSSVRDLSAACALVHAASPTRALNPK